MLLRGERRCLSRRSSSQVASRLVKMPAGRRTAAVECAAAAARLKTSYDARAQLGNALDPVDRVIQSKHIHMRIFNALPDFRRQRLTADHHFLVVGPNSMVWIFSSLAGTTSIKETGSIITMCCRLPMAVI